MFSGPKKEINKRKPRNINICMSFFDINDLLTYQGDDHIGIFTQKQSILNNN